MLLDISLTIIAALCQFGLACLGCLVTVKSPHQKKKNLYIIKFIIIGSAGCISAMGLGIEGIISQNKLASLLQNQTQQIRDEGQKTRAEIDHFQSLIGDYASTIALLRDQAPKLHNQKEAKAVADRIFKQYDQLSKGISELETGYNFKDYPDRLSALQRTFEDLRLEMSNIQTRPFEKGEALFIQSGYNTFRVTFPTPMIRSPTLTFFNIPKDAKPIVVENSPVGFTVIFTPFSIPVKTFDVTADAGL